MTGFATGDLVDIVQDVRRIRPSVKDDGCSFTILDVTLLTLDPTDRDEMKLDVDGVVSTWTARADAGGAHLIAELTRLHLTSADTLRVVVGPGPFTALRTVTLVANAFAYATGVQLLVRIKDETTWRHVTIVVPEYGAPPAITPPKVR